MPLVAELEALETSALQFKNGIKPVKGLLFVVTLLNQRWEQGFGNCIIFINFEGFSFFLHAHGSVDVPADRTGAV